MVYSEIPNNDIDPESPLTESLFFSLRDNPDAIANGDLGAPKIQGLAIQSSSIFKVYMASTYINNVISFTSIKYPLVYSSTYSLSHSVGQPEIVFIYCECTSTLSSSRGGWQIGDVFQINCGSIGTNSGFSIVSNFANLKVRTGSGVISFPSKHGNSLYFDTAPSNFSWFIKAFR